MTKARFYIKGKPLLGLRGRGAEPYMVQDVGYCPYIMKEIIKREGVKGLADNYKLPERIAKELKNFLSEERQTLTGFSGKPLLGLRGHGQSP